MNRPRLHCWRIIFGEDEERFAFEVFARTEAEARKAAREYGEEIEIRVPEDAAVVRVLA